MRTIVSPSAYQAISSPWRISLGLFQKQNQQTALADVPHKFRQQIHRSKKANAPERPKPDGHGDVLFGSLRIHRETLGVEILRLAACRRRRGRALTVGGSLQILFRRRGGGGRRRIGGSRAAQAQSIRFRHAPRRHRPFRTSTPAQKLTERKRKKKRKKKQASTIKSTSKESPTPSPSSRGARIRNAISRIVQYHILSEDYARRATRRATSPSIFSPAKRETEKTAKKPHSDRITRS